MRIALDVMGGDHAPDAIIKGALDSLELLSDEDQIILVGDGEIIRAYLERAGGLQPQLMIVETTQHIGMDELPVEAVRSKPDSSIVRMSQLASRKATDPVDVIISAGNTGACVTASQMYLRRLPGVHRPGIAVTLPTFGGPVVICDVGANPDPKAHHLWQYAIMAEIYCRELLGIEDPKVALLNFGGEEAKGTEVVKVTRDLLLDTPGLNYVGYIEGRDMFEHAADVVVTDAFVGNVVIKLSEGLAAGLFQTIAREILESAPGLAAGFEPVIKSIYARHDYHEFGGAPLLGINGNCLICHGSSEARTIYSTVKKALSMVNQGLNDAIIARLAETSKVGVA